MGKVDPASARFFALTCQFRFHRPCVAGRIVPAELRSWSSVLIEHLCGRLQFGREANPVSPAGCSFIYQQARPGQHVGVSVGIAPGPKMALGQHLPFPFENANGKCVNSVRLSHGSILRELNFEHCHVSMSHRPRPATPISMLFRKITKMRWGVVARAPQLRSQCKQPLIDNAPAPGDLVSA